MNIFGKKILHKECLGIINAKSSMVGDKKDRDKFTGYIVQRCGLESWPLKKELTAGSKNG